MKPLEACGTRSNTPVRFSNRPYVRGKPPGRFHDYSGRPLARIPGRREHGSHHQRRPSGAPGPCRGDADERSPLCTCPAAMEAGHSPLARNLWGANDRSRLGRAGGFLDCCMDIGRDFNAVHPVFSRRRCAPDSLLPGPQAERGSTDQFRPHKPNSDWRFIVMGLERVRLVVELLRFGSSFALASLGS